MCRFIGKYHYVTHISGRLGEAERRHMSDDFGGELDIQCWLSAKHHSNFLQQQSETG